MSSNELQSDEAEAEAQADAAALPGLLSHQPWTANQQAEWLRLTVELSQQGTRTQSDNVLERHRCQPKGLEGQLNTKAAAEIPDRAKISLK